MSIRKRNIENLASIFLKGRALQWPFFSVYYSHNDWACKYHIYICIYISYLRAISISSPLWAAAQKRDDDEVHKQWFWWGKQQQPQLVGFLTALSSSHRQQQQQSWHEDLFYYFFFFCIFNFNNHLGRSSAAVQSNPVDFWLGCLNGCWSSVPPTTAELWKPLAWSVQWRRE